MVLAETAGRREIGKLGLVAGDGMVRAGRRGHAFPNFLRIEHGRAGSSRPLRGAYAATDFLMELAPDSGLRTGLAKRGLETILRPNSLGR